MFIEWLEAENVFLVRTDKWKMPIDMVSFAVSTGLGVSVVAGILSGVCYVLVHGSQSRKKSNRKSIKNLYCDVCGEYFRSIDHILGGDSSVTCLKCQAKICQRRCAKEKQDGWICKNCLRPPETWYQAILYAIQPNKKEKIENKMDSMDTNLEENNNSKTREQVQDFIEKLVNSMLGQNIDDANVTKLYNDEYYLPLSGQQSPCTAHAALKQLIEKLLQEVLKMPALQRPHDNVAIPPDLNNRTYEELLATAILNKVISNSQNTRPSSSAASVSSRLSNSSNIKEDKEYFFGEETLDNKWKHTDAETSSVSSLEDWLQSDSSFGSKKYVDRVTLTIKQDIEELSQASESDDEEDDSEYFKSKSTIWADEEPNWFLQKRHFQTGTHSPVPVPMLVPNPTTEAKVLIGDKDVDETSDLSDVESEFGEAEIIPARHSILINSKTIIGGKNIVQNGVGGESGSDTSADSGVKEVDREQSTYDEAEFMDNINSGENTFICRADIHIDDDNVEDASLLSMYSNIEQEAEYTEHYASLPRQIERRPQPPARPSLQKSKIDATKTEMEAKSGEKNEKESDEEVKMVQMHFSGIYSRREKEKWKNAIEMKNNPYSKENIEKRIKRSNSGAGSLFGPDYYKKLASSPSGTKVKSPKTPEDKQSSWPPQRIESEDRLDNSAAIVGRETEKHTSKTYIVTEDDKDVHRAVPIVIEHAISEEPPKYFKETHPLLIEENNYKKMPEPQRETSPEYVAEITSDSDLSYINCYDVENSQVYKKSTDKTPKNSKPNKYLKAVKAAERTPSLRRFKSESDLFDHSDFDIPPKVLPKKRDNTIISKIYKVLSKSDLMEQPTFRTQTSAPDGVGYNRHFSDDERDRHRSRSQEALLRSVEISNNTMTITKKMSISSEDEYSDHSSFHSEYRNIRNPFSSSEDLLTIDETDRSKKKDNTLISKIYKQANVREYALKRQQIPDERNRSNVKNVLSSEDEVFIEDMPKFVKHSAPVEEITYTRNHKSDNEIDVDELAKKRIVHNILDKISHSKSRPDMNGGIKHNVNGESNQDGGGEEIITSVRDLMKKFENNAVKNNVVSSLTARSLSRHTRKPLKN